MTHPYRLSAWAEAAGGNYIAHRTTHIIFAARLATAMLSTDRLSPALQEPGWEGTEDLARSYDRVHVQRPVNAVCPMILAGMAARRANMSSRKRQC